ncbi:MAG: twin-arginine translocase TatA/TatE family subunit [Candidatus Paceibacterota bacterium]|jgi:Sec-independent protein translocase protein TatA
MFGFGTTEIILVAAVLVLFFGAKKIPQLTKSIVGIARDVKKAFKNTDTDAKKNNE